jgi:hypothetical protein
MMNDPLRRKMFREAGMSKQPMGILASSPELMNATQSPGYSHGGLHKANWMNNDNIYSPNLISYKNKALGRSEIETENTPTKTELENLAAMKRQETIKDLELVPDGSATNFGVDTSLETTLPLTNKINEINSSILKKEDLTYKTNESKSKKVDTSNDDLTSNNNDTKNNSAFNFKNAFQEINTTKQNAVTALAEATASADQYEIGGKTIEKRVSDFTTLVDRKGRVATLADVKDDAFKLLNYDEKTLEGRFDEDKQASIWLNMMKAGLAIASGDSPNALTNIAKGFAYGLDGYGKDVGSLKKELRADKKDYTNTMFKLLGDKKSEDLAKRTLEITEQQGLLNIQKQYVGEQKTKAIEAYKMKMDNAKWNVTVLGTIAKMDLDTQKYAFDKENLEKTYKLAVANATPKEIQFLIASKDIKLKDGVENTIPFGEKGWADQYDITPTGKKKLQDLASNLSLTGSNTDFKYEGRTYAATGQVGALYVPNFNEMSDAKKQTFGVLAARHIEDMQKITNPYDRLGEKLAFARQQGLKVKLNQLTPDEQKSINQPASRGGTRLLDAYTDVLDLG